MQLEGKVAIITGSTSGIGQAGARLFAREGAKVVISGRRDNLGQQTVDEIRDAGGSAYFVHTDTALVKDLRNLIDKTIEVYGRLDIFWHNSGVSFPGHIDLIEEAHYDEQMATALKGALFGTKFAVPEMRKAGGGCILFTSSMVGLRPSPYDPHVSLAHELDKGCLIVLARCLTEPLAKDKIRINCLCPGPVRTPHWEGNRVKLAKAKGISLEEAIKGSAARIPLGRLISVEEVTDAALFLVSDKATGITGVALPIDGGFAAI